MNKNHRIVPLLLILTFGLSGFAALTYQIIWARQLEYIFGTIVYAVSAILSVFFGGFALGSYVIGRYLDKLDQQGKNDKLAPFLLRLYAAFEVIVGIYALTTPWIFSTLSSFESIVGNLSFIWLTIIRFIILFFILIIPTTLMGATLPIMTKLFTDRGEFFGSRLGKLYSVNTLGGTIGVLLVGFILIAEYGLYSTMLIAVGINIIVGITVFLISRGLSFKPVDSVKTPKPAAIGELKSINSNTVLLAFAIAGFASLALEVLWTRTLIMIIGSSVYAFSMILAVFLLGIVIGSMIVTRFIDYSKNILRYFVIIEFVIGILIITTVFVFPHLPFLFLDLFDHLDNSFIGINFLNFIIVSIIILIPTILMGMAFPMAAKLHLRDTNRVGRTVGSIYSVNTIGGILGPIIASFVFIPLFGIQVSILICGYLYIGISFLLIVSHFRTSSLQRVFPILCGATVIVFILTFFVQSWNPNIMNSGVYLYANRYNEYERNLIRLVMENRIDKIYYKEGVSATVMVGNDSGTGENRVLVINGKVDASTKGDLNTEILLGIIPLINHQDPHDVMVVGLGSGITVGSILQYPVAQVDVVEISPEVIDAVDYFDEDNHHMQYDSRVNLVNDDARHFMRASDKDYDIIVSEPSNPWISGVSNLFTKEQFELYRNHLKPNGIVCQWTHLYTLSDDDIRTIMATFNDVFPYVYIWASFHQNDLFMIGSLEEIQLDFNSTVSKLTQPGIQSELARANLVNPALFFDLFLFDTYGVKTFSEGAPLNTDNHPILEFHAPKSLHNDHTADENAKLLLEIKQKPQDLFSAIPIEYVDYFKITD